MLDQNNLQLDSIYVALLKLGKGADLIKVKTTKWFSKLPVIIKK